jgi:Holliday junction resolvase RusA-like endonuclease
MTEIESADLPQVLMQTWVPGRPRTKGSMNAYCSRGVTHKLIWKEQVAESKSWKLKVAAQVQRTALINYGPAPLKLEVPLELRLVYFFRREDEDMPTEPYPTAMTVGDLDKLDRNIGDALTSSGLIKDDKYIVRIMSEKRWGTTAGVQLTLMQIPVEEREETWELLAQVPAPRVVDPQSCCDSEPGQPHTGVCSADLPPICPTCGLRDCDAEAYRRSLR